MSNPPLKDSSELEAFVIRGHHTTRFYNMLAMGMSVDEVIEYAENGPEPYRGYTQDVFGSSPEQAEVVRAGLRRFFEDFLNLPDDATVAIVAGQRDAICNLCVIGNHCNKTPDSADTHFLRVIGRLAREKGHADSVTETNVELEGRKKASPVLKVPAIVAREVLGDLDFHPQTLPRFMRYLARRSVRHEMRKR